VFYDKPVDSVPNPPLINDMSTIGHNQRLNQNRGRSAIIQTTLLPSCIGISITSCRWPDQPVFFPNSYGHPTHYILATRWCYTF